MWYTGDMMNDTYGRRLIQPPLGKLPPGTRRISRIPPRGIIVHGHPTSIRLEPDFWQFLREIAAECGCTMRTLIDGIATTKNPKWPLTSALRLYIAAYFRNANGQRYVIVDQLRG